MRWGKKSMHCEQRESTVVEKEEDEEEETKMNAAKRK